MKQNKIAARISSVGDARYYAERRLPRFLYQAYEAGSGRALTMEANVAAFDEVLFRPCAARFAPSRDLTTTVLGLPLAIPVILAPAGPLRVGHSDGERGAARAAGAAGTATTVSSATGTVIEDICAAVQSPVFYQLYYLGSKESAKIMIERASRAGCKALVLTVDTQAGPNSRERNPCDRAKAPSSLKPRELLKILPQVARRPAWLFDFMSHGRHIELAMGQSPTGGPLLAFDLSSVLYKVTPTWEDIPWIRSMWHGPLVVKGIITGDDARRAVSAGADAVVVSNHGGNELDGLPSTLSRLPEVVQAAGSDIEVLFDSGIRRGSDVVKAIALGARAVLIGRGYIYALMAAGEPGVRRILEVFAREIDQTLAFLGCSSLAELDPSYVEAPEAWLSRAAVV